MHLGNDLLQFDCINHKISLKLFCILLRHACLYYLFLF